MTDFPPEHGNLRPMIIQKVKELGLEIWTEANPEWETSVQAGGGGKPPTFTVESPDNYHPPAVMTIQAWRKERVPGHLFSTMAETAIRRASENYGLSKKKAQAITPEAKTWGVMQGYEGNFSGRAQGMAMEVKIFIGQQEGKFPVVAHIYTQAGKMQLLQDVVRRCWSNLKYL